MSLQTVKRFAFVAVAFMMLFMFLGADCGDGDGTPGAYSYNTAISTLGGTYTSNVIDLHYFVSITTNKPGTVPLAPGFGDVYSLVEYSTNGGVKYNLCHNTQGNPGNYFSFQEAPSTKEITYNWDVDRDLGAGATAENVMIRIRVFHAGDDPCSDAPMDIETSEEFAVVLSGENICGDPPTITTESIPDATDEEPYSVTFDAIGGYGDLSWSLLEPIDPAMVTGLSLTAMGVLAGTPMVQPAFKGSNVQVDLDVWVTDTCPEGARSDNRVYTLNIYPQEPECAPPPVFAEQTLPNGMEGEEYFYALQLDQMGEGALTFGIAMGALPDGLLFAAGSGEIAGIPATGSEGEYPITFSVTDSCETPQSDEISLVLTIEAETPTCDPGPEITTTELPAGTEGVPYDYTMMATGGDGALTWTTESTLPAGITFSTDGVFAGTPTEFGTFPLTIEVADECFIAPQTDTIDLDLVINEAPPVCADPPVIDDLSLPNGTDGSAYTDTQLTATDGEGTLTWSIIDGALPGSLNMDSDGLITGTVDCGASELSPYTFTVQVQDSCDDPGPQSDTHEFTITVDEPTCEPLVIDPDQTPPDAEVLVDYFYLISLDSVGEGTLTWVLDTIAGDPLPTGMEFNNGGITGVPEIGTDGSYNIVINVSDECPCNPQSDTFSFVLNVAPSTNPCFQNPVEFHTFCLECPETIPYEGLDVARLWFIFDGIQEGPASIQVEIQFNSEIAVIDQMAISPGDVIPNPADFSAAVAGDIITLTYDFSMLPQPIRETGAFAFIPIQNTNPSTGINMPMTITVIQLDDALGNPLDSSTIDCSIFMDGPT